MKLRPHHFLCIQKYTGHGYDERFTEHMNRIVVCLAHGAQVTIQEGCDDVCLACPNRKGDVCESQTKVCKLDEGVLTACNFAYGDTAEWRVFARAAQEEILRSEKFDEICGDCEWFSLCKETEETAWITQQQREAT